MCQREWRIYLLYGNSIVYSYRQRALLLLLSLCYGMFFTPPLPVAHRFRPTPVFTAYDEQVALKTRFVLSPFPPLVVASLLKRGTFRFDLGERLSVAFGNFVQNMRII